MSTPPFINPAIQGNPWDPMAMGQPNYPVMPAPPPVAYPVSPYPPSVSYAPMTVGPAPMASPVAVSPMNIPRPEELAPSLFNGGRPAYATPNFYPYNYNAMYNPYPYGGQQPMPQPPQPPAQQPPVPPPAAQTPPPPETNTPEKSPTPPGLLSEETVLSIDRQLRSGNDDARSLGAMEFYKLMENNPAVADDPRYKDYIDAFIEKIAFDSSPLVRQPLLLAMTMGYIRHIPDKAKHRLEDLTKASGLDNLEPGQIREAFTAMSQAAKLAPPITPGAITAPPNPGPQPSVHFGKKLDVTSYATPPSAKTKKKGEDPAQEGPGLNILSTSNEYLPEAYRSQEAS